MVCVIGLELSHLQGIGGALVSTLSEHSINLEMISFTAKGTRLSVVVDMASATEAAQCIHDRFLL